MEPRHLIGREETHGVVCGHTEQGEVSIEAPPMLLTPAEAVEVITLITRKLTAAVEARAAATGAEVDLR